MNNIDTSFNVSLPTNDQTMFKVLSDLGRSKERMALLATVSAIAAFAFSGGMFFAITSAVGIASIGGSLITATLCGTAVGVVCIGIREETLHNRSMFRKLEKNIISIFNSNESDVKKITAFYEKLRNAHFYGTRSTKPDVEKYFKKRFLRLISSDLV